MKSNNSSDKNIHSILKRGLKYHQAGNVSEAWGCYQEVLRIEPNNFDALHLSGLILAAKKEHLMAIDFISKAIVVNSRNAQAYNNLGIVHHESGEYALAVKNFNLAIKNNERYVEAYYNRGLSFQSLRSYDEAINDYLCVMRFERNHIGAINNLGNIYQELDRLDEAIEVYDKAIELNLSFAEPYNNRGNIFHKQQKYEAALSDFNAALKLNPSYPEAYGNRANTYHSLARYSEALLDYDKALLLKSEFTGALHNRANLYCEVGRLEEALSDYERALSLSPNFDYLLGVYFATKMRLCNWEGFDGIRQDIFEGINRGLKISQPFWLVAWTDSIALQKKAAEIWAEEKYSNIKANAPLKRNRNVGKLRIGYFSADFHDHATMHLMAELFELHDRDKIDLIGFSFGPSKLDKMRARIVSSFDEFYDVRLQTDAEVAALSVRIGIDIAVDLKGYTQNYRAGIFANRAAPVQVNFLGFPGTMGAKFIDYIIADRVVIPESLSHFYSEKVALLTRMLPGE